MKHYLYYSVVVIGQGFMAVNRPKSEGEAQGQGRFTWHPCYNYYVSHLIGPQCAHDQFCP